MEFHHSDDICHESVNQMNKQQRAEAIREHKRQEQERRDKGEIRSWGFDASLEMGI